MELLGLKHRWNLVRTQRLKVGDRLAQIAMVDRKRLLEKGRITIIASKGEHHGIVEGTTLKEPPSDLGARRSSRSQNGVESVLKSP